MATPFQNICSAGNQWLRLFKKYAAQGSNGHTFLKYVIGIFKIHAVKEF